MPGKGFLDPSPPQVDITAYTKTLHQRPLCGDEFGRGMYRKDREKAVEHRFIQHSHENMRRWLVVDLDLEGWFDLLEDSKLPMPSYTCTNPQNGHAHLAWQLSDGVSFGRSSRVKPQKFFKAVHRGFTRRISGDFRYHSNITKTPFHPAWETYTLTNRAYPLVELDDYLTQDDKKFTSAEEIEAGCSRNCDLFDRIRQVAYRESAKIKKRGGNRGELWAVVEMAAFDINLEFDDPLKFGEVRSTVKSVVNWTWEKYEGIASESQRNRSLTRWLAVNGTEVGKPWLEEGISRSLWYRRKQSLSDACPQGREGKSNFGRFLNLPTNQKTHDTNTTLPIQTIQPFR